MKVVSRVICSASFRSVVSHSVMFEIRSFVSIWRSIIRKCDTEIKLSSCVRLDRVNNFVFDVTLLERTQRPPRESSTLARDRRS